MSTSEDRTSGASAMAELHVPGLERGELREGYAEIGDVLRHGGLADAKLVGGADEGPAAHESGECA